MSDDYDLEDIDYYDGDDIDILIDAAVGGSFSTPYFGPNSRKKRYDIVCKRCGAGDLHWEQKSDGQRLRFVLSDNDGEQHTCKYSTKYKFKLRSKK